MMQWVAGIKHLQQIPIQIHEHIILIQTRIVELPENTIWSFVCIVCCDDFYIYKQVDDYL